MSDHDPSKRRPPARKGAPTAPFSSPSKATSAGLGREGSPASKREKAGLARPQPGGGPRRSGPVLRRRRRERLAVTVAPFWRRFLADLVDLALVGGTAYGAFRLGVGAPDELPARRFDWIDYTADLLADHSELFLPPIVILCAIGVIYAVLTRATMGATPGERLFGLRLLALDGTPCSPFRALFHVFGTLIGLGLGLVGYGWAAVDLRRQGLAEYLSGTLLIHGRPTRD